MKTRFFFLCLAVSCLLVSSGCGTARKQRLADLETQVQTLQQRLLESEKAKLGLSAELRRQQSAHSEELDRLEQQKEQEADKLLEAERALSEGLKSELGDARARLERTERGLVLTLLDEIFFDSGKAVIKPEGLETLDKVAKVLQENVPDSPVAVEGHTDNEPIRYSSWRTNWELSAGRALAVLHHFIEQRGVAPERMQAAAMGEFHPVASNDTAEGRRQNRRVEIVILPAQLKKVKE